MEAIQEGIDDGSMSRCLSALNALQAVPYHINEFIMDTVDACYEQGIKLKKMPPKEDVAVCPFDEPKQQAEVRRINRSYASQRVGLQFTLRVARSLVGKTFFTPYRFDYRGRLVPLTDFNFQRQDYVRAIFQFEKGEVVTADGLYWLKVHLANCGDFDKVSKKSFEARVAWVDSNRDAIISYANEPLEDLAWTSADKPFMFLAACAAYRDALAGLPVRLPVAFDGSCSGLQNLSAMTRDLGGALVNLTPSAEPADIYNTVAIAVEKLMMADNGNPFARLWIEHGITRKTTKQQVMTLAYGVTHTGMTDQAMDNTMDELNERAALENIPNPFSISYTTKKGEFIENDEGFHASTYLTKIVKQAAIGLVGRQMDAMEFLKGLCRPTTTANVAMRWTTALGFPVRRGVRFRSGAASPVATFVPQ